MKYVPDFSPVIKFRFPLALQLQFIEKNIYIQGLNTVPLSSCTQGTKN